MKYYEDNYNCSIERCYVPQTTECDVCNTCGHKTCPNDVLDIIEEKLKNDPDADINIHEIYNGL
jgi:hypothetical protein